MQPDSLPDVPAAAVDRRHIYRVHELTRRIKEALEDQFGQVWVEGEISNLRRPSSGHAYFTLKDEQSQISAVLFRGNQNAITGELKDGLKVRAYGEITVYESRGQYQIIVRQIEAAGKGALLEQFEKLKERLRAEGLFDPGRKQALPLLPRHLGIVTSPTGAAIRDMLQVLRRRFPNLHIVVAPVKVQGKDAAPKIARAIDFLNRRDDIDVVIVGRGGGSLEDLWAFNEEVVARAIAGSRVPVISAVGHETDFTISDFAADVRAPTPSAAAEIVVGRKEEFDAALEERQRRLVQALRSNALLLRSRFSRAAHSYVFREPKHRVVEYGQRLQNDFNRMLHGLRTAFQQGQQRTDELGLILVHRTESRAAAARQQLRHLSAQVQALGPRAVLERGYSITRRTDGQVVQAAEEVDIGETLVTLVARGTIESTVSTARPGDPNGREAKTD